MFRVNVLALMAIGLALSSLVSHAESLSAKFETIQCAQPCTQQKASTWWLLRDAQSAEIRSVNARGQLSNHSSVWERRAQNKLHYTYLMHDEKRAIQYSDVDLNILGLPTDQRAWELKHQLITNDELTQLTKRNDVPTNVMGYAIEHYQGQWQEGTKVDVMWMPALQLPYRVRYEYPQHTVEVQLQQLAPSNTAKGEDIPVNSSGLQLSQYQLVDYTDIGDMEHNPDDLAWMAKAVGAPGLHHDHHAH